MGVFRVKNHDFTPKNHIFSNFRGRARRVRPPPGSAPGIFDIFSYLKSLSELATSNVYKMKTDVFDDYPQIKSIQILSKVLISFKNMLKL